jgi:hypothetical protein
MKKVDSVELKDTMVAIGIVLLFLALMAAIAYLTSL